MSSISPVSNTPPPPTTPPPTPTATPSTPVNQNQPAIDPSLIVGQHGHGGGAHKGSVNNAPTQQSVVQQQQQAYVFAYQELQEIHQYKAEETEPEKNKEDEESGQPKKQKQPSMKTKWKRANNARLKI